MTAANLSRLVLDRHDSVPATCFDSNGVRKAVIAFLQAVHDDGKRGTVAELLLALEIIDSHLDGRPHSMKSLAKKLGIPYTSVSRMVYSLTSDAVPDGILKLVTDANDRRRKHIKIDFAALQRRSLDPQLLERAMIDYYGGSVGQLTKAPG